MFKARFLRLVVASVLMASPVLVPMLAETLHLEATTSAATAVIVQNNPSSVHTQKANSQKTGKLNGTSAYSADEAKANKPVEARSMLLWAISLIGLSLMLRWTIGNRQKQNTSTPK